MSFIADIIAEVIAIGASAIWRTSTDNTNPERTADTYINGMHSALLGHGLTLEATDAARNELERRIEDAVDVESEISNTVNTPLVEFIRRENLQSGNCIILDADGHEFVFRKE